MKTGSLLVVGATSGIAQACTKLWLNTKAFTCVYLVGRNSEKLERITADLRVRFPNLDFHTMIISDFCEPEQISSLVSNLANRGKIDLALIAHGELTEQSSAENDPERVSASLMLNGISPVMFAEQITFNMNKAGGGKLVVIGSVAGDRGRKLNYIYGSAKGLIERYVEGLQHRYAGSSVSITLVKPGPTLTDMTLHLSTDMNLADVNVVARDIVRAAEDRTLILYTPRKWAFIMYIVRSIPRFLFNKLDI